MKIIKKYKGLMFALLLGILFITLRISGQIDWNWWWVTAPWWGIFALFIIFFILHGLYFVIQILMHPFKFKVIGLDEDNKVTSREIKAANREKAMRICEEHNYFKRTIMATRAK